MESKDNTGAGKTPGHQATPSKPKRKASFQVLLLNEKQPTIRSQVEEQEIYITGKSINEMSGVIDNYWKAKEEGKEYKFGGTQ